MTDAASRALIVVAGQPNAALGDISLALAAALEGSEAVELNVAVRSTALDAALGGGTNWAPDTPGSLYDRMCESTDALLDPTSPAHVPGLTLGTMVWIRGEADAKSSATAARYAENLDKLNRALSDRYGEHALVLSGLSDAEAPVFGEFNRMVEPQCNASSTSSPRATRPS